MRGVLGGCLSDNGCATTYTTEPPKTFAMGCEAEPRGAVLARRGLAASARCSNDFGGRPRRRRAHRISWRYWKARAARRRSRRLGSRCRSTTHCCKRRAAAGPQARRCTNKHKHSHAHWRGTHGMYKATLRDIEQKFLGADEAHTALLREVSDEHPAGLEGQPPGPHCPASTFSGPPPMSSDEHGGGCGDLPHVNPNRGRSGGLKGLVHIYVKSICVLGTPPPIASAPLAARPVRSANRRFCPLHTTALLWSAVRLF